MAEVLCENRASGNVASAKRWQVIAIDSKSGQVADIIQHLSVARLRGMLKHIDPQADQMAILLWPAGVEVPDRLDLTEANMTSD
jgi:hypothetical protein